GLGSGLGFRLWSCHGANLLFAILPSAARNPKPYRPHAPKGWAFGGTKEFMRQQVRTGGPASPRKAAAQLVPLYGSQRPCRIFRLCPPCRLGQPCAAKFAGLARNSGKGLSDRPPC